MPDPTDPTPCRVVQRGAVWVVVSRNGRRLPESGSYKNRGEAETLAARVNGMWRNVRATRRARMAEALLQETILGRGRHVVLSGLAKAKFEREHPRGRGGRWIVKVGDTIEFMQGGKKVTGVVKEKHRASKRSGGWQYRVEMPGGGSRVRHATVGHKALEGHTKAAPAPETPAPPDRTKKGKLTAAERRALPASEFIFPKRRAYPYDTEGRARSALSYISQHGSKAEQRIAQEKVRARYPNIQVKAVPHRHRRRTSKVLAKAAAAAAA